jgi:hypothetical protein
MSELRQTRPGADPPAPPPSSPSLSPPPPPSPTQPAPARPQSTLTRIHNRRHPPLLPLPPSISSAAERGAGEQRRVRVDVDALLAAGGRSVHLVPDGEVRVVGDEAVPLVPADAVERGEGEGVKVSAWGVC